MALIWRRMTNECIYEVRTAGASVRLYTNGVLHSEYNHRKLITGSVWDLLFVPTLYRTAGSLKKVAVMGLGGGAVIHMLKTAYPEIEITAIDIDSVHIGVCKKYFGLSAQNIRYVHADARDWLRSNRSKYDVIVDDLFGHVDGETRRAIDIDTSWMQMVKKSLKARGLFIANFADAQELRKTSLQMKSKRLGFGYARRLYAQNCQNVIVVTGNDALDVSELNSNRALITKLDKRFAKLSFRSIRV